MRLSAPDLYKYLVMIAAGLFLAQTAFYHNDLLQPAIIPLVLLFIVVEFIQIPIGGSVGATVTYGVTLGTMILYGPHVAGPMLVVAYLTVAFIQNKAYVGAIFFNAALQALSVYLSYYVYEFFDGTTFEDKLEPNHLLILIPTTLAFIAVNHLIVYGLFYFQKRTFGLRDIWEMTISDLLTYLIATPFVIFELIFFEYASVISEPSFFNYIVASYLVSMPYVLFGQLLKQYHRITRLNKINEFTSRLQSESDLEKIYSMIVETVEKMTVGSAGAIVLWTCRGDLISPVAMTDSARADFLSVSGLSMNGEGIAVSSVRNKRLEVVNNMAKSKQVKPMQGEAQFQSAIAVPIFSRDEVIGVITCFGTRPHAFPPHSIEWVKTLAGQVGVIIGNVELQETTLRDPGTGLYNYRYFYQELSQRFAKAKEANGALSIIIIDIDHFKKYNDTYGHVVGDEVLRQTGQVIQNTVGAQGVVTRYGGEEFAVLLDEPPHLAKRMVEQICHTVARHKFEYQGYVVQGITVSIGLATYPDHDDDEKELLEKADQAMYWGAKQRGRNKVAVYTPEFDANLFVDQQTGLHTYHYLQMKLTEEFTLGSPEHTQPFALIFLHVIDFNNINSTFGLEIGNLVLREISAILKQHLRNDALASRYGGDEFLLLIPGVERTEAEKIGDRIVQALAQHPFRVRDNEIIRLMMRSDVLIYPHEVSGDHSLISLIPENFLRLSSDWAEAQTQEA